MLLDTVKKIIHIQRCGPSADAIVYSQRIFMLLRSQQRPSKAANRVARIPKRRLESTGTRAGHVLPDSVPRSTGIEASQASIPDLQYCSCCLT